MLNALLILPDIPADKGDGDEGHHDMLWLPRLHLLRMHPLADRWCSWGRDRLLITCRTLAKQVEPAQPGATVVHFEREVTHHYMIAEGVQGRYLLPGTAAKRLAHQQASLVSHLGELRRLWGGGRPLTPWR